MVEKKRNGKGSGERRGEAVEEEDDEKRGHGDEEGHVGKVNLMRAKDRQTHMVTGDENEVQGIKEYNKKILPHIE